MNTKMIIGYIVAALGSIFFLLYHLNSDVTRIDTMQKVHIESDVKEFERLSKPN